MPAHPDRVRRNYEEADTRRAQLDTAKAVREADEAGTEADRRRADDLKTDTNFARS